MLREVKQRVPETYQNHSLIFCNFTFIHHDFKDIENDILCDFSSSGVFSCGI
jgi:hypothetical protein